MCLIYHSLSLSSTAWLQYPIIILSNVELTSELPKGLPLCGNSVLFGYDSSVAAEELPATQLPLSYHHCRSITRATSSSYLAGAQASAQDRIT